jgi:hypothetical protein
MVDKGSAGVPRENRRFCRTPRWRWRALDAFEIYRAQRYASAVYRSELAREVQNLGYRIELTPGKNGAWELEGYTREQVMAFSQRRQDIEQAMAEAGVSPIWAERRTSSRAALACRSRASCTGTKSGCDRPPALDGIRRSRTQPTAPSLRAPTVLRSLTLAPFLDCRSARVIDCGL